MKTNRSRLFLRKVIFIFILSTFCFTSDLLAGELLIGTATADITPPLPVAVAGQFYLRIANNIETPVEANILVIESRDGNTSAETAVMVSCDVVGISEEVLLMLRSKVKEQLPGFDVQKIFLTAIHTHTAPVLTNSKNFTYPIPVKGVLQVEDYRKIFVNRIAEGIVKAWNSRGPGSVTWGLGHAAVAYSRRVVYSRELPSPGQFSDGTAKMYGKTNIPEFINMEGMEDHDINSLFFWNKSGKVVAMAVAVACPAQEVMHRSAINADYWYPVREKLKKRFGNDLCVLGWITASGDLSPAPQYRKAAEERMIKLRNLTNLDEIARRIVLAVEETYETVKEDRHPDVKLIHKVETLILPGRLVTEEEYEFSKAERDKYAAQIDADPKAADQVMTRMTWNKETVERYGRQKIDPNPICEAEVHILRLGDVAICTNEFELFSDYGIRIQARSNALQTFVIQLAAGSGGYLPTEKAVRGGGYSAVVQSGNVGPEGGQILVDRTVELINKMFPEAKY